MPQYRDLSKKYEISSSRYRELLYFCRQYDEKKNKVKDAYSAISHSFNGSSRCNGKTSAIERATEKVWKEKHDTDLIEKCVNLACDGNESVFRFLLKNVTSGTRYEELSIPMGRRQFYELRRFFFWILNNEKG